MYAQGKNIVYIGFSTINSFRGLGIYHLQIRDDVELLKVIIVQKEEK